MLESILIKNFQVHKRLKVNLDPHLTVIVGPNDAGKSAILRALRWAMLNDPVSGDTKWGAAFSKVQLKIDGKTVTRKRTKAGNVYLLNNKRFVAFRSSVPPEIEEFLNVSELNFQSQLEAHFWLSLPAPQAGREMNQIVNLGMIDTSLARVAKLDRKAKAAHEIIKSRLGDARDRKKSLSWVVEADAKLQRLEQKQAILQDKQTSLAALRSLVGQVKDVRGRQRTLANAAVEGQFLLEKGQWLVETAEKVNSLRNLINATIKTRQIRKLQLPDIKVFERYQTLKDIISQFHQTKENLCQVQKGLSRLSKLLAKQETCPLCGTLLSLSHSQTCTSVMSPQ